MTKLEILEVFGVTLNELFEKMPALECVEVNSITKRTMGTLPALIKLRAGLTTASTQCLIR